MSSRTHHNIIMHTLLLLSIGLLFASFGYANTISGSPCSNPPAALRDYLTPSAGFPGGCDVGPLNYTFLDFGKLTPRTNGGYAFNSEGGTITPDNLFVVPNNDGTRFGVTFQSDAFQSDFSGETELYFLAYAVDPPPILVGEELSLSFTDNFARRLFANAAPSVTVREYVCANNLFVRLSTGPEAANNQCTLGPGSSTSDPLSLLATLDRPFDSVRFGEGVPLVSIHLFIELSGDLRGTGFNGVGSSPIVEQVPEPFTVALTGSGLFLMAAVLRRRSPR